jgi:hypothetical protein
MGDSDSCEWRDPCYFAGSVQEYAHTRRAQPTVSVEPKPILRWGGVALGVLPWDTLPLWAFCLGRPGRL